MHPDSGLSKLFHSVSRQKVLEAVAVSQPGLVPLADLLCGGHTRMHVRGALEGTPPVSVLK